MMKDRRRKIRVGIGGKAKVRVTEGFAMRPCTIENQSDDGVCLKLEAPQFIEDRFVLLSQNSNGPGRACRVKWRRQKLVGAEYISSERKSGA